MTGATRYPCPLNCGWHHDEPEPSDISGLTCDSVDESALAAMTRQARRIELTLRAHFATHGWDEWAPALIAAQNTIRSTRAKAAEWTQLAPANDCGPTITATALSLAGRQLLALLDQPDDTDLTESDIDQAMAESAPVQIVTSHTFEGTPAPGSRRDTGLFGQTCSAAWEQHEPRDNG